MTERDLELLSAYLDSALTNDERAALESRLATDADLRRELALLRETKILIASLPQLRSPRNLTLTLAQVRQAKPRRSILISPWTSIASASAAFLLIASGIFSLTAVSRTPQAALVASAPTQPSANLRITLTSTPLALQQLLETDDQPQIAQEETSLGSAALMVATGTPAPTDETQVLQAAAPLVVTGTPAPLPTMMPPSAVGDAARGDGFAPMTFTPSAADAANAVMESAPAGGFTTDPQAESLMPSADLMMGAAVPETESSAALSLAPASTTTDTTSTVDPGAITMMMVEPTPTTLAYAATLPPTPAPTPTVASTIVPTEAAALSTPQVAADEAQLAAPPFRDPVGVTLIFAGMLFLFVAVATTLFRLRR
jgi:hypothetical protein